MFCSRCGTKNPENSANCYNCGQKMATSSDLPQPGNRKPLPQAAPPPRRGENTPLHSNLATHFSLFIGQSSYRDLEQRFLSNIRNKMDRSVPLEPDEMTLLAQINQAKTEAIKQVQNAAAEAVKKLQEQRPKANQQAPNQFDTEKVHGHEYGLISAAAIEGVASGKFASHLHPEVKATTSYGGVTFKEDPYVLQEGRDQKYAPAQIWENTKKWLRIYMSGAVVDELLYGITFENNDALVDDIAKSENLLLQYEIDAEDARIMIQMAFDAVMQNFIDHPDVLEAILANSLVREKALSQELHASEERLANFQTHVRQLIYEQ